MEVKAFALQTMLEFAREFENLFYAQNSNVMASYYAVDAKLLAEGMETVQGRESIEQFWRSTCERAGQKKLKRSIEVEDVFHSENFGYATGRVLLEPEGLSGQGHEIIVRYATIWRRYDNGTWRIILDISNQQPMQRN
jgi:ketosteroid isomerase-like protein